MSGIHLVVLGSGEGLILADFLVVAGGSGGSGGGGSGGSGLGGTGGDGGTNTGGGGGGAGDYPGSGVESGQGGSGIAIMKIKTAYYTGTVTGGASVTTSGAYTYVRWTSSGSYTA